MKIRMELEFDMDRALDREKAQRILNMFRPAAPQRHDNRSEALREIVRSYGEPDVPFSYIRTQLRKLGIPERTCVHHLINAGELIKLRHGFYRLASETANTTRMADRIDGYDRDDLGESPDY